MVQVNKDWAVRNQHSIECFKPKCKQVSYGAYLKPGENKKFIIDESRFINFAIGNYHQFISTFQDDFTAQILDSWFAIDETGEPSRASQAVLGYEQFIGRGLKVQIEGYYKKITDMLTYEESRATTDGSFENKSLLDLLTPADGYAYGAELFIQQLLALQLDVSIDDVNMEKTFMEAGITSSDLMIVTQAIQQKISSEFFRVFCKFYIFKIIIKHIHKYTCYFSLNFIFTIIFVSPKLNFEIHQFNSYSPKQTY